MILPEQGNVERAAGADQPRCGRGYGSVEPSTGVRRRNSKDLGTPVIFVSRTY